METISKVKILLEIHAGHMQPLGQSVCRKPLFSGQWDISVLDALENHTFFYVTAGGDEKASGGQDEVMTLFDQDQVPYSVLLFRRNAAIRSRSPWLI